LIRLIVVILRLFFGLKPLAEALNGPVFGFFRTGSLSE
jgi:hypothetical protein